MTPDHNKNWVHAVLKFQDEVFFLPFFFFYNNSRSCQACLLSCGLGNQCIFLLRLSRRASCPCCCPTDVFKILKCAVYLKKKIHEVKGNYREMLNSSLNFNDHRHLKTVLEGSMHSVITRHVLSTLWAKTSFFFFLFFFGL